MDDDDISADAAGSRPVERTADGHYIIVNGRRWRAADPTIPPKLNQELVDELMAARRAVRAQEPDARSRVGDAKNALGERGYPWWEEPTTEELETRITAAIRTLVRKRSYSSICPSDVARVVGGPDDEWRSVMTEVRRVAADLARREEVVVTQKGEVVDLENVKGPVRISRGPAL